nr:MAG TPA: hypothetical protein [Caudoviricetes sp.]
MIYRRLNVNLTQYCNIEYRKNIPIQFEEIAKKWYYCHRGKGRNG